MNRFNDDIIYNFFLSEIKTTYILNKFIIKCVFEQVINHVITTSNLALHVNFIWLTLWYNDTYKKTLIKSCETRVMGDININKRQRKYTSNNMYELLLVFCVRNKQL